MKNECLENDNAGCYGFLLVLFGEPRLVSIADWKYGSKQIILNNYLDIKDFCFEKKRTIKEKGIVAFVQFDCNDFIQK